MEEISNGIAIIPGATSTLDGSQFFQSNDFLYFTGVDAPNGWLVVDGVNRESILLLTLSEQDAQAKGVPAGLALDPAEFTGIEKVLQADQLEDFISTKSQEVGHFCVSHRPEELHRMNTDEVHRTYTQTVTEHPFEGRRTRELQLVEKLGQAYPNVEIRDCQRPIQRLRFLKAPAEVALVREASRIGVEAHLEVMRSTEVAMPERALAALFEFTSKREGAQELAYDVIPISGRNHPWGAYHRHDRSLRDGDTRRNGRVGGA